MTYGSGKVTSFGQAGQEEQVFLDSISQVFTPRSIPVNISIPVESSNIHAFEILLSTAN